MKKRISSFRVFAFVAVLSVAPLKLFSQFVQNGGKIVGTGAIGNASQGQSVAMSTDGSTAIVGGYTDNTANGAAWVYVRSGNSWVQQGTKLVGSDGVYPSRQGVSSALSADGNTAIIGGYVDDGGIGAIWVFTRSGDTWTQQGPKLVGTGAVGASWQGISVALSSDGNTAIAGAFGDNGNIGAAWIFVRNDSVWSQQGSKLVGTGTVGTSGQGQSVGLSADGNTAIVGGYTDNSTTGAAWIFTRSAGVWTQQGSKLVGTGGVGGSAQGVSVAITADGNTAIIGGHQDSSNAGAAWIFTRNAGTWSQVGQKLRGSGSAGAALQGRGVAISADGTTALIGGPFDNGNKGAVWVYRYDGSSWNQIGTKLVGTGGTSVSYQGFSAALSGDGNTIVEAGPMDESSRGAAWIFKVDSIAVVGEWNMDEASGTVVHDNSGYGNDGSAFNSFIISGHSGNARSFDGVSSSISVPDPSNGAFDFGSEESFTVSMWFQTAGDGGHLIRRGLTPAPGFLIGVWYGHIKAIIGDFNSGGGQDTLIEITSDKLYNDNTWHHVTFVRDRSVHKLFLYIDDEPSTLPVEDNFSLPLISDRPLTMGRWENPYYPGYFTGSLDEVKITKAAVHPASANAPVIVVRPQSWNYGKTLVGSTSLKNVEISNAGLHDTLVISNITSTNGIFLPSTNSMELRPGEVRHLDLLYAPVSVHQDTATILISSNDSHHATISVPVSGEGYEPSREPIIAGIQDIPHDQGGQVRVIWSASIYDGTNDSLTATEYNLWRRVDPDFAAAVKNAHHNGTIFEVSGRKLAFVNSELWDYIARIPAVQFHSYAYVAPTTADSTAAGGIHWTTFEVSAHMKTGEFYFSQPDSGYSTDGTPPAAPSNVVVHRAPGSADVNWEASADPDIDHYEVYGGTVHNFIADQTSIIGRTLTNEFVDEGAAASVTTYYRVKAFDKAGNQSSLSNEAGGGITSVGDRRDIPSEFRLFQNYPNPFNPSSTLKYDVASESNVIIRIYNITGQEIATIVNERKKPGTYHVTWNAENRPTGIYFVKMTAGEFTSLVKMILIK